MDFVLTAVAGFAASFLVVHVIIMIVLVARMIKQQFQAPLPEVVPRELPADWQCILDAAATVMQQAGFEYRYTCRQRSLSVQEAEQVNFFDVYYHPQQDVHAQVHRASIPTPQRACDIYLVNSFVDGRTLISTNGLAHMLLPNPASVTIQDAYAVDFAGQLAAHLQARAAFAVPACAPEQAFSMAQKLALELFPAQPARFYCCDETGQEKHYAIRLMAALQMAWRMRLGSRRLGKMTRAAAKVLPLQPPQVQQAANHLAFVRLLVSLHNRVAPRWFQHLMLPLSALLFIGLGGWLWSVPMALVLGGVILWHEAGHWLCMKLAGFRDVQVFFVPGFGGATSGEKHEAAPLVHLAVYLGGPVPGVLLALVLMLCLLFGPIHPDSTGYAVMASVAMMLLIVNGMNLLPIMPLDGGRVIDLFLMRRFPWVRLAFTMLSSILLFAWGWYSDSMVMLIFGAMTLAGVVHHYRQARALAVLRREKPQAGHAGKNFTGIVSALDDFLTGPAFAKLNLNQRIALGQGLLPHFMGRLPGLRETVIGLLAYVASIALPVCAVIALLVVYPDGMRVMTERGFSLGRQPAARDATVANAQAAPRVDPQLAKERALRAAQVARSAAGMPRLQAIDAATEEAMESEDDDDALRLARLYRQEAASLPPDAFERARSAYLLARMQTGLADKPGTSPRDLLEEAAGILHRRLQPQRAEKDGLLLADVLEMLAQEDGTQQLQLQQEAVQLYAQWREPQSFDMMRSRATLARKYDEAGLPMLAEAQLRLAAGLDGKRAPDRATVTVRENHVLNYAWFLVAHQRSQEALQVSGAVSQRKVGDMAQSYAWRDAHLLAAVVAHQARDWPAMAEHAKLQRDLPRYPSGSRWLDWLNSMREPPHDLRGSLLLLEAERKQGHAAAAGKLLQEMAPQLQKARDRQQHCRFGDKNREGIWRNELSLLLLEIEQREFPCKKRPLLGCD